MSTIRLMTHNIWNRDKNSPAWEEKGFDCSAEARVGGLLRVWQETQPDVIGCQEASALMADLVKEGMPGYTLIWSRFTPILYRTDKLELVEKRRQTWAIILAAFAVLAFCIAIIRRYAHRLKQKPDDEAMSLIRQRLSVLDKVLASHISSDDKAYRISEEEIENLISDRESFLISTKIVFKENHPGFISILEQKGLSDWEIGYCCLFTLGLKGKEVGEFIQKKRHYIISSEIRKKLGLGEHDTNIGIWLRTLLSETENL